MTTPIMPFYRRAPSTKLMDLLKLGGFLAPGSALAGRQVAGGELDVHLRSHDTVHVYRGLTKLLDIQLKKDDDTLVNTYKTYRKKDCVQDLFHSWTNTQVNKFQFAKTLNTYLKGVTVARRWIDREGSVQSLWSRRGEPWVPFDREAELSYKSTEHRTTATWFYRVDQACDKLAAIATSRRVGRVEELRQRHKGRPARGRS